MKEEMLKFAMTEEERAQVLSWCKESGNNPYELCGDVFTGYNGVGAELFNRRFTPLSEFIDKYGIDANPDNLPYRAWISWASFMENGKTRYNAYIFIDTGNSWSVANRLFLKRPFSFLSDYVKALEKAMETFDEKINMNLVSRDDVLEYFYENMNLGRNGNKDANVIMSHVCDWLGCNKEEFKEIIEEEVTRFGFESEYLL
jgi:hypothetical protein